MGADQQRKERKNEAVRDGRRRLAAQRFIKGKERQQADRAAPRDLPKTQRQPGQHRLVGQEVHPARARGEDERAEDKAQRQEKQAAIRYPQVQFRADGGRQQDETGRGQQHVEQRDQVQHGKAARRVREQRDGEIHRAPAEVVGVPQQVVVSSEQIVRVERRLPALQVPPHLGQERQADREIIVGQEIVGTPDLEQDKKKAGGQERPPQQAPGIHLACRVTGRGGGTHFRVTIGSGPGVVT